MFNRKLVGCIGEYKRNVILSPIFVAVEVAMDILIPFVMTFLLNQGIKAGNIKLTVLYGLLLVGMSLVALLFGALSGIECSKASCGFAKNIRKNMYDNVQTFAFSNVDKFSPSSIVTRMTTDVTYVQNAFQMLIRIAVRCPLMLIFAIIMTVIVGGPLAVVYVVVIPIMLVGLFLIFNSVRKVFTRLFKKYDDLNRVVEENIRGIRVVKSNVREKHEIEKFDGVSEDIYKDFTKAQKILALNNPLMQLAMYLSIVIIAWFGSKMIIGSLETTLDVGELSTLITYTTQILMSLMMLSMVFANITISKASAERICKVLEEDADIKNPEKPVYNVVNGDIEFKNVNFSYSNSDDKKALDGVSLKIESGQTIGIIGGTGSSKTTLVQLIPRLFDVTEGEVLVGGENVKNYDLTTLRKSVAMVLQKNVLFSGSVRENLLWGNENATDDEINKALAIASADEFVNKFEKGLDTHIEQGGANVSGGQKQRLCIARALLANPKILILDDSTSAVDVNTERKIRKAFRDIIPNTTKIIIAQRIASVIDADKIIVMQGGKIENIGTHSELLKTSTIYSEVYNSQVGGGDFDEDSGK